MRGVAHWINNMAHQVECSQLVPKEISIGLRSLGLPGGSDGKAPACNARDPDLILGLGSSPGEGNGHPLQYSCLENFLDGGTWWGYSPWGCKELDMTE